MLQMAKFEIENWVESCEAHAELRERDLRDVDIVRMQVLHRFNPLGISDLPDDPTPAEIAEWFHDHPEHKTGRRMPYHVLYRRDGRVQQCVPASYIAPAAGTLNRNGLQVAIEGDLRYNPPTVKQAASLVKGTALFWRLGMQTVTGHSGHAGSSEDPSKICPGEHIVIPGLVYNVKELLAKKARRFAEKVGAVL